MRIGFVGAGKVGKALGLFFSRRGLTVSGYYSKTPTSAGQAAELTGSGAYAFPEQLVQDSEVVFLTVSDGALAEVDAQLAKLGRDRAFPSERCFLHTSGALPSSCLMQLAAVGCAVGSMHPLQSFGETEASVARLDRTLITLEGTKRAVEVMEEILRKAGALSVRAIPPDRKPLYHAGACIASNYLVTLLESALRCFEAAGIGRVQAIEALLPLMESALENVRAKGPADALTGPIARGDAGTVSVHMEALSRELPLESGLYRTMAERTFNMIQDKNLTKMQRVRLLAVLKKEDGPNGG